ncbi:MAG TPA: hypothetical protein VGO03_21000 [Acidimicrobiia bacterium]
MDQVRERGDGPARGASPITHLAIVVVYALTHDDDIRLLDLHLERIERHTRVPYTIFAVTPRLNDEARRHVVASPHTQMCDIAPTARRGSREHGYYLDEMVPLALEHDVSHLCTLDVDSFPIDDAWLDTLLAAAPPATGLVGVLREENGDVALPHPSCILAPRGFYEQWHPSFWPEPEATPEFRNFVRATGQRADTGIRLASLLWNERLPWGKLRRSNAVNPHFLLGGIYGDAIFHMGGITRDKVFRTDLSASRVHKLTQPLAHLPAPTPKLKERRRGLLRRLRRRANAAMAERNGVAYRELRQRLLDDADGLIAELRGVAQPPKIERGLA